MTREEAIKELKNIKENIFWGDEYGVCFRDEWVEAYEVAISALREQSQWISVKERLPEAGERVLTTDGAFVGEMYINKQGKWQRYNVNDSSLLMALDILWWMPLPEPPEEEV